MARTDDVNIRLRLLGARDVVRGTSAASRSLSGMSKKIDKVGARSVVMAQGLETGRRGVHAIGTALKWTGLALGGLAAVEIPRALNAFREAEKAERNVEAAIRSTGGAANVTGKDIDDLSERMMFKTGIDDEEIKNAAAMLLTFKEIRNATGKNNKVFDETLQTTADMAARFGSDMPNAAKQLAKALNDPSQALSALRRSGVSFTDEQTDMINKWFEGGEKLRAQKYILEELSEQTKGAAASQADSVDIMKAKWGELEERIGAGLMPLFEDLADLATDVTDEVSAILDNDKLTGEQKFDRVMDVVDERVKEGIEKLDDYLPLIAEAGAGLGARLAVSLGKAFLESNIWGKLFIGLWLTKILLGGQGVKLMAVLGGKLAVALGQKFLTMLLPYFAASTAADSIGGLVSGQIPGLRAKFGTWGRVLGAAMGAAAALALAAEIKFAIDHREDMFGTSLIFTPELDAPDTESLATDLTDKGYTNVKIPSPNTVTATSPSGDKVTYEKGPKGWQKAGGKNPGSSGRKKSADKQGREGLGVWGGGNRTVVFQVPLNGKVLAEKVISEAELAAALR